jgi:hypothetical protein
VPVDADPLLPPCCRSLMDKAPNVAAERKLDGLLSPGDIALPSTAPRFYKGDLPPRIDDVERVRRTLRRTPATRQALIQRTGLSQTRVLCAIDALIASGQVAYDGTAKAFTLIPEKGSPVAVAG